MTVDEINRPRIRRGGAGRSAPIGASITGGGVSAGAGTIEWVPAGASEGVPGMAGVGIEEDTPGAVEDAPAGVGEGVPGTGREGCRDGRTWQCSGGWTFT